LPCRKSNYTEALLPYRRAISLHINIPYTVICTFNKGTEGISLFHFSPFPPETPDLQYTWYWKLACSYRDVLQNCSGQGAVSSLNYTFLTPGTHNPHLSVLKEINLLQNSIHGDVIDHQAFIDCHIGEYKAYKPGSLPCGT
jgi:hypothetical protein